MRTRRLGLRLLLLVVLLAFVAVVAAGLWVRGGGRPRRTGTAAIPGLSAPVEVRWDRWGIPYVEASNGEDLAAALGYLHANDRLTQLELGRRMASGRLAELVGERAIPLDRQFRTLRFRSAAERLWQSAGDGPRSWLEAYARGVNARIGEIAAGDRLPPDLRLLYHFDGGTPEPWTPVDSLCFVMLMANDLSFWNDRPEEERFAWLRELGPERTRELIGAPDLVVPAEIAALAAHRKAGEGGEEAEGGDLPAPGEASAPVAPGSNNWVIGASHTASGRPIVANDPHLGLRLPGVWFQVLLRSPDYAAAGMTLPGLPGIVIGRNADLAWGLTNVMLDDHDLFFEEVDEAGERVRRGDGWAPIERSRETIRVRGGQPVELELAATDLGPLLPADRGEGLPARSLAWTLYQPADPLSAFQALGHAASVEEALAGLAAYAGPAQNLVIADRGGDLAWTVLGRIPDRGAGDGRLPSPAWRPEYRWRGLREWATNPVIRRPADDLLVTANNQVVPEGYPLAFAADYDTPDRADRIRQRLVETGGWTPAGSAGVQTDVVSLYARRVVASLGDGYSGDAGRAQELLAGWDGEMGPPIGAAAPRGGGAAESAAALFALLERALREGIFGDEARVHALAPLADRDRLYRVLAGEMDEVWFDDVTTPATEGRRETIEKALARSWGEAVAAWGGDPARWSYSGMHTLLLAHPLGGLPLVGSWFNRGPFAMSGSATTVAAFGARWQRGGGAVQEVTYGPSMRFTTDAGDPDSTLTVVPGGQSGNPADPHYADQLDDYLAGRTHPFPWSEEGIAAATVSRLSLVPAGDER